MALSYIFPNPSEADGEGLLAAGGDLSVESLLTAYSRGIFPWYDDHSPILWWSPDPRMVLFPDKLKVSESLNQKLRQNKHEVRIDENFHAVIHYCAGVQRREQNGTWITREMKDAYILLHQEGYAHSFETYLDGKLVGGLYGVSLGKAFFGESMFHLVSDASKIALFYLVTLLKHLEFDIIDAQQSSTHLKKMGAEEIPRKKFLEILSYSMQLPTIKGCWSGFSKVIQNLKEEIGR